MWSTCFACIFVLPRVPCVNSLFAITVAKTVIAIGCQRSAPFANDTRSPPPGECLLCVPQSHDPFFICLLDLSVLTLEHIVRKSRSSLHTTFSMWSNYLRSSGASCNSAMSGENSSSSISRSMRSSSSRHTKAPSAASIIIVEPSAFAVTTRTAGSAS